jgi:hypothetical protein
MFHQDEISFTDAKKNVNKQSLHILHDIVSAFQKGVFDDPSQSALYCNMLACICEGKIEGKMDEESMDVFWSLTPSYQEQLDSLKEALASKNVVAGPW